MEINTVNNFVKLKTKHPSEFNIISEAFKEALDNDFHFVKLGKQEINRLKKIQSLNELIAFKYYSIRPQNKIIGYLFIADLICQKNMIYNQSSSMLIDSLLEIYFKSNNYNHSTSLLNSLVILYAQFGKDDILKSFHEYKHVNNQNTFWPFYNSFCDSLHLVKIKSINTLSTFLISCYEIVKNDLANFKLFNAVQELCITNKKISNELYNAILKSNSIILYNFIPNILLAQSEVKGISFSFNKAVELINEKSNDLCNVGMVSLSLFDYKKDLKLINKSLKIFELFLQKDLEIYGFHLTTSYANLYKHSDNVIPKMIGLSMNKNPHIQKPLSSFLLQNLDKVNEDWFKQILLSLASVDPEHNLITSNIDSILIQIINSNPNLVLSYYKEWFINHEIENNLSSDSKFKDIFKNSLMTFYNMKNDLLCEFITACFNEDNYKIHNGLSNLISTFSFIEPNKIHLDKKLLDTFNDDDIIFIAHKIIGYVYASNILLLLFASFLKKNVLSTRIINLLKHYLVNYIGYNYPGTTLKFFEELKKSNIPIEKSISSFVIKNIDSYFKEGEKLLNHSEFQPPKQRVRLFNQRKLKTDNKSFNDNLHKSSILLQMIPKTILKGGKKWFTKTENGYTDPSHLSEVSRSIEMPRGEFLNPLEQDLIRFNNKILRKNN